MSDVPLKVLVEVSEKPLLFVQSAEFTPVVAFCIGYDMAMNGAALVGFREWLLFSARGDWTNLPWWSLVRLRFNAGSVLQEAPSSEEEVALLPILAQALRDFSIARESGGLVRIYYQYARWLLESEEESIRKYGMRLLLKT